MLTNFDYPFFQPDLVAAAGSSASDPNQPPAPFEPTAIIGANLPRIDGPLKTTGRATYAADYSFPHLCYAAPVASTIGNGKIASIDTAAAEKMPGVLLVLTHQNIGGLLNIAPGARSGTGEARIALSDDNVNYWGQYVAVAVAETFEQAQAAAAAINVKYNAEKPNVSDDFFADPDIPMRTNSRRGDTSAFESAPVKVDQVYSTPAETHNPMEMHATVAVWDGTSFTMYESSQNIVGFQRSLAGALSVPGENLRVISRFIGSGFGGKLSPWPQAVLAAAAARKLNRPVKMTVPRNLMFTAVGHRPATQQRLRIGATPDGKLVSLEHNYRNHTSITDERGENCGEATPFLYSTPNLAVTSGIVKRNVGAPCPMRGPGAVPGLFAVESAMDELAIALKMDPVELRLRNDTLIDESNGRPFSSRHYKECLQVGAERFGWSKRTPAVGSMRKGDVVLGWGVAGASWGAGAGGSEATVILKDDGTARVSSGTQDPGTGTYTVMAQVLSDRTGIPVEHIDVVIGDSTLVPGPGSGGSRATATIIPAVADGAEAAAKSLLTLATQTSGSPFYQQDAANLAFSEGRVHTAGKPAASGIPFQQVLKLAKTDAITVKGRGTGSGPEARNYSTHSFGAQFAEVEWDPGIARLRVTRVVSVIDGGRMINLKTATNQVSGAVVMGIGMALFEQNVYDPRNGHPVNDNFADYIVPTNADAPVIDVHFLEIPDNIIGKYGARGIGEIGLAGVAPAITAAVYHATGVRVRNLPVRIEDLLTSRV
ncbi:MAG TPA: xanthine dehydrogenase family protein molybdopterin-binding subunit [Acidobacteriaceae bacterium]|nr:xanthine dehydrogenase family protein molybdopterin-binding subunit [Acidobacteriaceae bacterium]